MSITLQEKVSNEVRAWLARRRLSASKAAAALGWTDMYMSRRLNNKIPFDLNDLEALARLLEVPVPMFFENVDKDLPAFTGSQLVGSAGQRSPGRDITNASWFDSPSNRCATPPETGNLIRSRQNPIVAA
jgi:transcriptional regulator with XRE-family HTH domain